MFFYRLPIKCGNVQFIYLFTYHEQIGFLNTPVYYTHKGIDMSNPLSTFVKTQRKLVKLSQEELAFKAGVGLRFLRELEQGKQTLRLDKVNQVLELFGKQVGITNMEDRHVD
ncbi:y4mF family transcriptional regulator [Pedobacter alluvionis]|uniref:Y4mF family transcriptional regulator n=2 Tax=Pedobacter alluvionis TaxID=475253 RepID=A0A497XXJ2_9SPHI|nr:y4mF family transcriptional regulator [Pedobacter alluvionis]